MFNLPDKELEILKLWQEGDIFKKTLAKEAKGDFVFYEGPPTANGKPGIHHVLARAFKDVIPRYKTMNGYRVERKAGWDTHGLPVELEVEKKLGLKNKKDVEEYGIKEFNEKCKESVWQYIDEWQKLTERIGFWVDMDHPYVTYSNDYVESLWWIVKQAQEKNLLYKGYKVIPQCPRCGTALSSHEVAQGYKNVEETSVYIKFKVKDKEIEKLRNKEIKGIENNNLYILAWTTTPWTLPGNVALAVGSNIKYSLVKLEKHTNNDANEETEYYILASDLAEKVLGVGSYTVVQNDIYGENLIGLEYEPLFPGAIPEDVENYQNAFKVYGADFVSTVDGTGVVHTAVMYGLEDYELGEKVGLPKYHTVNLDGTFIKIRNQKLEIRNKTELNQLYDKIAGKFVKDCDKDVIEYLENNNLLFKTEKYKHDYPFCWRCGTPLIYYAKDSWYFKMSALREQMIQSNETINWVPEHIKEGRFGEWLKEVKDWAISRERYWGTPLPVWVCQTDKSEIRNPKLENKEQKTEIRNQKSEKNTEEKVGCGHIKVIGGYEELGVYKPLNNTYYLLRHGEAENNVADVLCCKLENDHWGLTEKGKKQIENHLPYLKEEGLDFIFHSPFQRTTETAKIVADGLGVSVTREDDLWEVMMGDADGQSDVWVDQNLGGLEKRLKSGWPNGESIEQLRERAKRVLVKLEKEYTGKKILLVSHGDTLTEMVALLNGKTDLEAWRNNYVKKGELRKFAKAYKDWENGVFDPHRPFIDDYTMVCEKCGGEMRRVSEVMDCWFDSGSMPLAQVHYPFNLEAKESQLSTRINANLNYPADFISEAIDQTRGWFYTLLAVATILGKEAPYKNVICLGHILDKNGLKMSKSKGNIVDPWEMINKYGADSVRWHLYTINQPGEAKRFDEKELKEAARIFTTLFNVLSFYKMYVDNRDLMRLATRLDTKNVLDKWMAAKLNLLIKEVTECLEKYDIFTATRKIGEFVDELSTWYVRRSRERFKGEDKEDKNQAIFTLGKVLFELARLMAPFTPFVAEQIYQELGKPCGTLKESVHLEEWPAVYEEFIDQKILDYMEMTRKIVEMGLAKRAEVGIKVRQPLKKLEIRNKKLELEQEYLYLLKDELNVREVEQKEGEGEIGVELDLEITEELREEGMIRELTRAINNLRKEAGLTIDNWIKLEYNSNEEIIEQIFVKYGEEIKKTTLTKEINKTNDNLNQIKINEFEVGLKIVKI